MQSERYDSIEYNDEWESIPVVRAEPVGSHYDYEHDIDEEYDYEEDYDTYSGQSDGYRNFEDIKPKKTDSTPQPVIKLQFLLAFIILVFAFILKNYGGDLYNTVSQWYFDNLNNSLIVTMKSQNEKSTVPEENTENVISTTDITEDSTKASQQDNVSTEPSILQEQSSDEQASAQSSSEIPTDPTAEQSTYNTTEDTTAESYTTQAQPDEEEDEY